MSQKRYVISQKGNGMSFAKEFFQEISFDFRLRGSLVLTLSTVIHPDINDQRT